MAPVAGRPASLFPREHGAWAMLLLPFASAAILARSWSVATLTALVASLAVFLLREPLVILLRQKYVWRQPHPETATARRYLRLGLPVLALSGLGLLARVPGTWLLPLAGVAALLTGVYAYGALGNHQRSPLLQVAAAVGLSSSAWLAYLATGRAADRTILYLWIAHVVHSAGSVLVVHARLEALTAFRGGRGAAVRRGTAVAWQMGQAAVAVAFWAAGRPLLAAALALPVAIHAADLARLDRPDLSRLPLKRVGQRELALGSVFSILTLGALW